MTENTHAQHARPSFSSARAQWRRGAVALFSLVTLGGSGTALACSAEPLIGSVCFMATDYCPQGYVEANGQLLAITQYQAAYALFGTMFGGDGHTTFGVPDLRGRSPVGVTANTTSGDTPISAVARGALRGQEQSKLQAANLPPAGESGDAATVQATTSPGTTDIPSATVQLAKPLLTGRDAGSAYIYAPIGGTQVALGGVSGGGSSSGGTSAPFTNLPPQIALRACVALDGTWPTRPTY